jgi:predicted nucleic acid-binding protein
MHELFATSTHPSIDRPPTEPSRALAQIDALLASPSLLLRSETDGYWSILQRLIAAGHVTGARVHDARIAALCLCHGVAELGSADRDFTRFPDLVVRNPLVP